MHRIAVARSAHIACLCTFSASVSFLVLELLLAREQLTLPLATLRVSCASTASVCQSREEVSVGGRVN